VSGILFDHIAIATRRIADAPPYLVGVLGGVPYFGMSADVFRFGQWEFDGGGRIEVLEPRGDDGFLHRFLATRGPGVHHVTFKVPDLAETRARAKALGYGVVGYNASVPRWKEAFLHPKEALGIVVQIVEAPDEPPRGHWRKPPPMPADPPPPVRLLGLRLRPSAVGYAARRRCIGRGRPARFSLGELAAADRGRDRSNRRGRSHGHRGGAVGAPAARPRGAGSRSGHGLHGRASGWSAVSEDINARVRVSLDALGVPYEVMSIDPDFADTAQFCAKYGIPLDHSANTIIVASKKEPKQYCACVVLATTRLDVNHAVKKLMGVSRVSFASAEETMALTGMRIGGVTVFALPPDVPLYVDERLMALDWLILGGGGRDSKIRTSPEVFRRMPNTSIVPGLATEANA